ncbi:methionyl-tRNA formyltransferase [Bermanella marisrubri]|uniref:Methionyl-tRNA formyltransferase n=1 Tax=Bermanella marisrubri TaxID=207949 RepID=Q1N3W3_9GAMM|nr:methionyl-tRNA formyltransferase [Bermanella marisrubri]EAT13102.1 methionyl-tRNA formyltransferase [Oceanobacter sp. RED65] [Bermanella marisrubri]
MKVVFAGTPDFAASHLQALLNNHVDVVAVYTQPDRPAGRGKKLTPSPVKRLALENQIPVYQPENFKQQEDRDALSALQPDLMVVVAYGLLLPQAVLDIPKHGCINSHASLLPRWRGAAPIQRAIEAGDSVSGVTVMQMEAGLDTGPMIKKVETPIMPSDTGGSLHDRLMEMGSQAVVDVVAQFANGQVVAEVQDDSLSCYAKKLTKDEALVDWRSSAEEVARKIRAFNPFPCCYTLLGDHRIRLLQAQIFPQNHNALPGTIMSINKQGIMVACGEFAVVLEKIQLPSKKPMNVADVLNGKHPFEEQYVLASEQ